MNLIKFLSVGGAWIGQRNEIGRYRISSRHLLPRFETDPAAPCATNQPIQAGAGSGTRRCGLWNRIWRSRLNPFHGKNDSRARAAFTPSARVKTLHRVESNEKAKPWAGALSLQGELALEQVAVVRNDLALDDLEFVRQDRPKMPGVDSGFRKVAERPFQRGRGMPWNQLTAKLFVAGRSRFP